MPQLFVQKKLAKFLNLVYNMPVNPIITMDNTELQNYLLLILERLTFRDYKVRFKHTNKELHTVTKKGCRICVEDDKTYKCRFLKVYYYVDHHDGLGELLEHCDVAMNVIKKVTIDEKGKITIKAVNRWVNNDDITLEII